MRTGACETIEYLLKYRIAKINAFDIDRLEYHSGILDHRHHTYRVPTNRHILNKMHVGRYVLCVRHSVTQSPISLRISLKNFEFSF